MMQTFTTATHNNARRCRRPGSFLVRIPMGSGPPKMRIIRSSSHWQFQRRGIRGGSEAMIPCTIDWIAAAVVAAKDWHKIQIIIIDTMMVIL
jgi:hypothetical protein